MSGTAQNDQKLQNKNGDTLASLSKLPHKKLGTINMSGWAVERWDPLTAHIDVCSKQSLIWAVGKIPKNCGFVLPLILMITFSKH